MDIQARAAFIIAQAVCAQAAIAAMQLENECAFKCGERYPPHPPSDFHNLTSQFMIGHNDVIAYLRD